MYKGRVSMPNQLGQQITGNIEYHFYFISPNDNGVTAGNNIAEVGGSSVLSSLKVMNTINCPRNKTTLNKKTNESKRTTNTSSKRQHQRPRRKFTRLLFLSNNALCSVFLLYLHIECFIDPITFNEDKVQCLRDISTLYHSQK